MKTLDDIENLADNYHRACKITGNEGCAADEIAVDVLALLPVVRAAEAWLKQPGMDWQRTRGSAFGEANHALANALDQLHKHLEGK